MDGGADPQLRSVILSGRQHFISVQLTAAAGLDISLTDGEAGWRGSVSSSQLTHPLHMGVSEFRSRLVDGLLANGPSTASDELKLHTNVPHYRELEWRATMRQAGLEISLRQVARLTADDPQGETLRRMLSGLASQIQALQGELDSGAAAEKRMRAESHQLMRVEGQVRRAQGEMVAEAHQKMLSTLNCTKQRIIRLEDALQRHEAGLGGEGSSGESTPSRPDSTDALDAGEAAGSAAAGGAAQAASAGGEDSTARHVAEGAGGAAEELDLEEAIAGML